MDLHSLLSAVRSSEDLSSLMSQIHINPGMIAATHKVRRGLADHHILHYLPQTQSHLIPKGQFDYAVQWSGG